MQILVDADACPSAIKSVVMAEAAHKGLKPIFICSTAHYSRLQENELVILVDKHWQEADMAIANRVKSGDLVVTGDYGLAAMVLGKGGRAISHRGYLFTGENIDELLLNRHISSKIRKSGGRVKGPAKISKIDIARFRTNFSVILAGL